MFFFILGDVYRVAQQFAYLCRERHVNVHHLGDTTENVMVPGT